MEPKFQSSFIPKGPIGPTTSLSSSSRKGGSGGLLGLIAKISFVLAILASVGVFGYDKYLESSITKMGADLDAARATLDPASIRELTRLNSRIVTTEILLSKHTVLSPLFDYLQSATVKNVRFTQFSYSTTDKGLTLSMKGQARGYSAVALQADTFAKSKYIKNPLFGDLNLDNNGNVIFSFISTLDPSVISYKKQIEGTLQTSAPSPTIAQPTVSNPVVQTTSSTSTATSTQKRL